jgi:HAD superfamily hydrolase (TIGR01549 family)
MGRRDGLAHKPSPEPLIYICNELDIKISETLMVGDTELDIQCGKSAGSKLAEFCLVTEQKSA